MHVSNIQLQMWLEHKFYFEYIQLVLYIKGFREKKEEENEK